MELYILRHAIAEDPAPRKFKSDSLRPLTDEGRKKMKSIASGLLKLGFSFDVILSSPYVRTKQTADIVSDVFKTKKKPVLTENLASSGGDPKRLIAEINKNYSSSGSILLVGHEPYLSGLVSVLISGSSNCSINMKKAGLAKLTADHLKYGQCATLEWLMTPKQMIEISG